jgi:glycosyltransferase involved in cell wall biosynthesis
VGAGIGAAGIGVAGLGGGVWTALQMTELSRLRRSAAGRLFALSSRVVAVCEWVRDLLIRNGVPAEKIALCRQGLAHPPRAAAAPEAVPASRSPLRIAFFGRLDAVKGVHILIEALYRAPDLPVTLDLFAVVQGRAGDDLKSELRRKIGQDARVRFRDPVAAEETVERLREYDVLAVPSQWMETGPMVVYEAFAAGIPVVGSNLGGIAELVTNEKNGLLVEAGSVDGWVGAMRRLAEDRALLATLRRGIGPVRTMRDVAREMLPLYEGIVRRTGELVH